MKTIQLMFMADRQAHFVGLILFDSKRCGHVGSNSMYFEHSPHR